MLRLLKLFSLILVVSLVQSYQRLETSSQKYRVAVIHYQHETCTFCPGGDTEIKDWIQYKPYLKGKEVLKTSNYIKGFVEMAKQKDGMQLVGINSPGFVFGSSSRSWNSNESFEHFMKIILDDLKAKMPVQGVYLALHGALAVRDVPRPEAEIARRVREVVGEDIPIVGSFDLHGNEDEEFLKWANGAFAVKEYPHNDASVQGGRSANYLYRAMKGEYQSTTATIKPPIITATVLQWTGQSPSSDIMERAKQWEARHKDVYVSVFYGFPWSDVPDAGATVHVMTNNDQQLADSIAKDMADYIWLVKEDFAGGTFPMPEEAVKKTIKAIEANQTPVVIGDYSDRPGDATWILQQLVEQGVSGVLFACLTDASALKKLKDANAKPGDEFDMEVGGYTGVQAGKPVRIKGKVSFFSSRWSYENIAVIDFGKGNTLILTPVYTQIITPEDLKFAHINPDEYKVFVVKSRVHFRRGFDETGYAKTILVVDAPGPWFGTTRLDALDYKYAPIDKLYPFEKEK